MPDEEETSNREDPQQRPDDLGKLPQDEPGGEPPADPSRDPNKVMLAGFLADSSRIGYQRLYLTTELTDYIEFREEDVARSEPVPPEQSSVGGTRIWLDPDAIVERTRIQTRQVQARFLQGDLMTNFWAGMDEVSGGAGVEGLVGEGEDPAESLPFICPNSITHCG